MGIIGKIVDAGVVKSDPVHKAECPVAKTTAAQQSSGCPVHYKNKTAYNVYSQPLDPANQMPATANQLPAEGQKDALDTTRVPSSIPKGGTDDTWTYPSPQMVRASVGYFVRV